MQNKIHTLSKVGKSGNNKDALAVPQARHNTDKFGCCLALADGISRCSHGGEVARGAVKIVNYYYQLCTVRNNGETVLNKALDKIWLDFERDAEKFGQDYQESACTLTVVLIIRGHLYLRHFGDSSCDVFFNERKPARISEDFSDSRGRLLSFFGSEYRCPVQKRLIPFPANTRLLLSSDGFSGYLSAEEIAQLGLKAQWDKEILSELLIKNALARGSTDDMTFIYRTI